MEIFYAYESDGRICRLDGEESAHLVRVLRHRAGDEVHIIDGEGTMYRCRLTNDSPKAAEAEVLEAFPDWGAHPYRLTIGCCPTKNNERFETFVEKAVEIGVDCIAPLIGERSERKVYKTERAERIALSAAKQSLKAKLPKISEPLSVREFVREPREGLKLIAYCFDGDVPRRSIKAALAQYCQAGERSEGLAGNAEVRAIGPCDGHGAAGNAGPGSVSLPQITVLIGPEGDFSPEEAAEAVANGYIPVHLGPSRLRTETAAITAAEAVYFCFL